jgi:hypothetical protein
METLEILQELFRMPYLFTNLSSGTFINVTENAARVFSNGKSAKMNGSLVSYLIYSNTHDLQF